MPVSPYLNQTAANARLAHYGVDAAPSAAELELASDALDLLGGFKGFKHDPEQQVRQFPRDHALPGDTLGEVPQRILDWVSLHAAKLNTDDEPPVTHERIKDLSRSYARGKLSRLDRIMKDLLRPYRGGTRSHRIV